MISAHPFEAKIPFHRTPPVFQTGKLNKETKFFVKISIDYAFLAPSEKKFTPSEPSSDDLKQQTTFLFYPTMIEKITSSEHTYQVLQPFFITKAKKIYL